MHPDDVEAVWALDESARTGASFHAEYRIVRPDGACRWLAHHAKVVCDGDGDGRPRRMIGTLSDVTQRRLDHEALRDAFERQAAHAREHAQALTETNLQLANEVTERRIAEAQVRELMEQVETAEEDERRHIARELHDSVGQHLTALSLGLRAITEDPGVPPAVGLRLFSLLATTSRLDRDVDRLTMALRPTALDDLGLDDALREHAGAWAEESGIPVDLHLNALRDRRLPQALETAVYRIVQESLTNVRKHAQATRVSLIAELRDAELRVIVEDDGRGFETPPAGRGEAAGRRPLGLRGMRERALWMGGRFDVESEPGRGTTVFLAVPLRPDQDPPAR